MTQMGIHVPGARARRAGGMDIYTGLAFVAFVFLAAACVLVWKSAGLVGKNGEALGIHEPAPAKIQLKQPARGA